MDLLVSWSFFFGKTKKLGSSNWIHYSNLTHRCRQKNQGFVLKQTSSVLKPPSLHHYHHHQPNERTKRRNIKSQWWWPCNEIYNPSIELRLKWWSFQRWHFAFSLSIVPKLIVVWISLPRSSHYALPKSFLPDQVCCKTAQGFITNNFELGSKSSSLFIKPRKKTSSNSTNKSHLHRYVTGH